MAYGSGVESGRGSDAIRAARANARAAREQARRAAEEAQHEHDFPEPERQREPEPAPTPRPRHTRLPPPVPPEAQTEPEPPAPGPAPFWYPPLVGTWAAAFVLMSDVEQAGTRIAVVAGLIIGAALFFGWLRTQRGQATGPMPASFHGAALGYAVGVVATAVAAWLLGRTVAPLAGAAVAQVAMTVLVVAYERAYVAALRR